MVRGFFKNEYRVVGVRLAATRAALSNRMPHAKRKSVGGRHEPQILRLGRRLFSPSSLRMTSEKTTGCR
jgi:hypothetical protein